MQKNKTCREGEGKREQKRPKGEAEAAVKKEKTGQSLYSMPKISLLLLRLEKRWEEIGIESSEKDVRESEWKRREREKEKQQQELFRLRHVDSDFGTREAKDRSRLWSKAKRKLDRFSTLFLKQLSDHVPDNNSSFSPSSRSNGSFD